MQDEGGLLGIPSLLRCRSTRTPGLSDCRYRGQEPTPDPGLRLARNAAQARSDHRGDHAWHRVI